MTNHLDVTGWTADSKAFGYCVLEDGSGCYKCKFVTLEGRHQEENECGKQAEPNPRALRALKSRIKKRGFPATATTWDFGADLELSHTRWPSAGARFKGAKRGYHPLRFKGPREGTVHLAALQISPDGKWVGAIGHTFQGEYTDTYPVKLIEANKLAASTYNMTGLALHKKGQAAEAAKLFHKAAFADPEHAHATYNLACAWARTKDRRAAAALALAISSGGDAVKDKARRDADFADVRGQKWFSDLVGPAGDQAARRIQRAADAPIDTILPPATKRRRARTLSVEAYVRKTVCHDKYCVLTTEPTPCRRKKEHDCVAIDADPCAKAPDTVDCEGLWLTIVIDVTADPPALDHARSGKMPVRNQRDVQRLDDMAP